MKEEHYSPAEIKYNRPQFLWLVKTVCGGNSWPSDGRESGYSGGKGKKPGHHAPYELVKMIGGECETRLARCGQDGLLLEYTIMFGDFDDYTYQKLGNYMRMDISEVKYRVNLALKYCCGYHRKKITYGRFCYLRRNGNKKGGI